VAKPEGDNQDADQEVDQSNQGKQALTCCVTNVLDKSLLADFNIENTESRKSHQEALFVDFRFLQIYTCFQKKR
jgi:hypothetical protein